MVKKILIPFFLFILTKSVFAQSSGVLDASIVNERFFVTIENIDIGRNLFFDIESLSYANKLDFSYSTNPEKTKEYFKKDLKVTGLNYCYLFDEQETWHLRVFRTIDLNQKENEYFLKGSRYILRTKESDGFIKKDTLFNELETSLINIVSKGIKSASITPYQFPYFEYNKEFKNQFDFDSLSKQFCYVKIKEDWRYDRITGQLKCYPIGLAFLDKNKKELLWFYYPELKLNLFSFYNISYDFGDLREASWQYIFENHKYFTHSLEIQNHKNNQSFNGNNEDYSFHRNDFHALFKLELVDEHIRKFRYKYSGEIEDRLLDGRLVKGMLINGIKQGKWVVLYENGVENISVNYTNNVLHGIYIDKFANGKIAEKGMFNFGFREGEWVSYFENGKLLAKRNYKSGMLDGIQSTWYESGKNHLIYNYKNFQLNGNFKRWNEEGILTESGQFKDDIFVGAWQINLKISADVIELLKNNPNHNWGFATSALNDGYLTYSVNIEHITDMRYCTVKWTCLKRTSISEIK
jgi:antitoxin component YwqK of YwqJK toxin-antitoxin module